MSAKKTTIHVKPKAKETATAKEKSESKNPKKVLAKVPAEYVFWCNNGNTFSDLEELAAGFGAMSDETYAYHCNGDKQDFANWVRDVIKDEMLAADLARASNRIQAEECANARITILAENL